MFGMPHLSSWLSLILPRPWLCLHLAESSLDVRGIITLHSRHSCSRSSHQPQSIYSVRFQTILSQTLALLSLPCVLLIHSWFLQFFFLQNCSYTHILFFINNKKKFMSSSCPETVIPTAQLHRRIRKHFIHQWSSTQTIFYVEITENARIKEIFYI